MSQQVTSLRTVLRSSLNAFSFTLVFSCVINLLTLTVPIYMLQMFDRVLPSQSSDTLIYLTIIAIIAILVLGLLDIVRSHILIHVSSWIDHQLNSPALEKSLDHTLHGGHYAAQSLIDITTLRQFLSSTSIYAFFDAPWVIIFLVVIFLLHGSLGVIATIGAVLLFGLAILNEFVSRRPLQEANSTYIKNQEFINQAIKNAESIQAMGMMQPIIKQWSQSNEQVLSKQNVASERSSIVLGASKFIRMGLQVLILAIGAYLVVQHELTSGAMIAASIIMGRALSPVEQSISAWKQAIGTMQAAKRLQQYLKQPNLRSTSIQLPKPTGKIEVENLLYIPTGNKKPILQGVHFTLQPGESLGIIGPSGSGKSTLARLLVGIWQPSNGKVRLDGADIYQWDRLDIGKHLGYLPQKASLLSGNVRDNIARLNQVDDSIVIAAAKFVHAHSMILKLNHGYDTNTANYDLSGGQIQHIALARTFLGMPKFVVLDEPESHLDEKGLAALQTIFKQAKREHITLVVISQRPNLVKHCDKVLLMHNGRMVRLGRYDELTGNSP